MKRLAVGLTGGIGSGKSEALRAFARAGAATLSLDQVARRPSVLRAVTKAFGIADRAAVANRVFSNPAARRRLERLTHPLILKDMRAWLRRQRGVAVVEVPLLFEAGAEKDFDVTMTVAAKRRRAPKGWRRRAAAQWTDARRAAAADVVLRNDGSKADLRKTVRQYQNAFVLIAASQGGRNG